MSETERIWVKEFSGIEVRDLPGLIALGYMVYMSTMGDTQGWRVKDVKAGENPFDDPNTVLFVEDVLEPISVKPEDKPASTSLARRSPG